DILRIVASTHCCVAGDSFFNGDFAPGFCAAAFSDFFGELWLCERSVLTIKSVIGSKSRHSTVRRLLTRILPDATPCSVLLITHATCTHNEVRCRAFQNIIGSGNETQKFGRRACGGATGHFFFAHFFHCCFRFLLIALPRPQNPPVRN